MGWEWWLWLTWTSAGACCPGSALWKGVQQAAGTCKGRAAGAGAGDSPSGHLWDGCCSLRRGKQCIRSVRQQYPWSGLEGQRSWEQRATCACQLLGCLPMRLDKGGREQGDRSECKPWLWEVQATSCSYKLGIILVNFIPLQTLKIGIQILQMIQSSQLLSWKIWPNRPSFAIMKSALPWYLLVSVLITNCLFAYFCTQCLCGDPHK